ncbi:MAG TPA: AAA family ATPase, partial [Gemmatimonadaceae bacterium]
MTTTRFPPKVSTDPTTLDDLSLLIRARYPIVVLETMETGRAESLARQTASELSLHYYLWTRSKGLRRGANTGDPYVEKTAEPHHALSFIEREGSGIFMMRDLAPYIDDPLVSSHLLDAATAFSIRRGTIIIAGHQIRLPDSLRPYATTLRVPAPDFDDYRQLVERVVRDHAARMPIKVELSPTDRVRLVNNLLGLPLVEAEKIIARLILQDGALRPDDIVGVVNAKRDAVRQEGLLEYYPPETGLDNVAGLHGLKTWLTKRRAITLDPQRAASFGLRFPKGVLLLGMPGCGKSMCAKAVACEWGLPLLKLDPSNLYDKYIGNSEKNFTRALAIAERMSPVILWIDEIEKAFASEGGEGDGGVSRRVFGTFLSWLHERRGDVFVIATSNDVSKLPPEFIRKGRFDEVFFVDLPSAAARAEVYRIHLARRKQDPSRFDLPKLAAATEGFSGAEIEESV